MIQAGSLDVRYPCTTVNQILSSNWVQFPVSWATDEDEQNLIPGLKTCVINSLKEGGSARVSAALVADGATPTVLHAGPMNLCIILDGMVSCSELFILDICDLHHYVPPVDLTLLFWQLIHFYCIC